MEPPENTLGIGDIRSRVATTTPNLGGGNWIGGAVFDDAGQYVAYVSYNARVWLPESDAYKQHGEVLRRISQGGLQALYR